MANAWRTSGLLLLRRGTLQAQRAREQGRQVEERENGYSEGAAR